MVSISHKTSHTAAQKPLPTEIERGELAINTQDRLLYTKDPADNIIPLDGGGGPDRQDIIVDGANGVASPDDPLSGDPFDTIMHAIQWVIDFKPRYRRVCNIHD